MSYAHLVYGIIIFVAFLITGLFMREDFPDKESISQEFRLLIRSRHIYILFSALLHILLGLYFRYSKKKWQKGLQVLGSVLLFVSSVVLVCGFVFETYYSRHFSEVSRWGIYLGLGGVIVHLIGAISFREFKEQKS